MNQINVTLSKNEIHLLQEALEEAGTNEASMLYLKLDEYLERLLNV